jgi:S-layer protein (TIGR01567 family)
LWFAIGYTAYPGQVHREVNEIKKICFIVALLAAAISISLFCGAWAQDAAEFATVRGNLSYGDGTWRANDFGWFYYDLDEDAGGEELQVKDVVGRTAKKGDITYLSRPWSKHFDYAPWGSYEVLALFGKLYLASYPDSSFTDEVSSLAKGELREILRDEDTEYTLTYNTTLPLAQGYSLTLGGISEKNDVVNFALYKNEKRVYDSVVSIGEDFVYKMGDVPVILVHLANAMGSEDGGFAEVNGIFQTSDSPIAKLVEGGILGNMKLEDLSEEGLEFRNAVDINLKRDSSVFLTQYLLLVVLDQPTLIYYPVGIIFEYGIQEIRGPAFSASTQIPVKLGDYDSSVTARWKSLNYSGFYFDPEDMLGDETLVLYSVQDRRVSPPSNPVVYEENNTAFQKGFQYTTLLEPKEFEFKPWGYYLVINFLGMQWFAGYDSSLAGTKASKSLLEKEYLGRVLIDEEYQGVAFVGNYSLQEGYEIRIRDLENDSIFLELLKDGASIEGSVVRSNSTYIYEKDLGDVDDLPIIMVHVDNVFNNISKGFATIDAIFQISDQFIIHVEEGNGIGEMQIVNVDPLGIWMVNDDYINLNRDSTVSLAPMMNIRVADNDTLRYYLYTQEYIVPSPSPPTIIVPDNVTSKTPASFTMIEQAAEIREVTVEIVDSSNRTVFSRDITNFGQGSGEFWMYNWVWNATTLQLSDDNGRIMDVGENLVPALLRLNQSSPEEQVGVYFNSAGRIGRILKSDSIYYVSRSEYEKLNVTSDYDSMLANETIRRNFIKIELDLSTLRFQDIVNGRLDPSAKNHTLHGTIDSLEPHVRVAGAEPGRYELRVRIENAVNAIQTMGDFFNVSRAPMRGISLGSAEISAGETASIPVEIPSSSVERWINLTYDSNNAQALGISGNCSPSWQLEEAKDLMRITFPANCSKAELSFKAIEPNEIIDINVTGWSGFEPEDITNGTITVLAGEGAADKAKKSNGPGYATFLLAIALAFYLRSKS